MVHDLNMVLVGKALSDASGTRLENWMLASKIDGNLLHAGRAGRLAGRRQIGGKEITAPGMISGSSCRPRPAPIVAAVFYTESAEPLASREQVIADAGRIIAQSLGA